MAQKAELTSYWKLMKDMVDLAETNLFDVVHKMFVNKIAEIDPKSEPDKIKIFEQIESKINEFITSLKKDKEKLLEARAILEAYIHGKKASLLESLKKARGYAQAKKFQEARNELIAVYGPLEEEIFPRFGHGRMSKEALMYDAVRNAITNMDWPEMIPEQREEYKQIADRIIAELEAGLGK
jgi:hypothetical protein